MLKYSEFIKEAKVHFGTVINKTEPNFDLEVSDLVDRIFFTIDSEFHGHFFPLKVFANKYFYNNKLSYGICICLGPGIEDRLSGPNEDWIFEYQTLLSEKYGKKYNLHISNSGDSSGDEDALNFRMNKYFPNRNADSKSYFDTMRVYDYSRLPDTAGSEIRESEI